ncbi:MAG: hypothetical protein LC737_06600, partial [Chloroflexi bacterium]|nr:hypothetical protein [Chloroflexota bacterium]
VRADARHVSVYRNLLDRANPSSPTNPKVIAFTVADSDGHCAAGVIRGYPTYGEFKPVDIGSAKCMAQSVLDVLRK